jgi:hypothetical protein
MTVGIFYGRQGSLSGLSADHLATGGFDHAYGGGDVRDEKPEAETAGFGAAAWIELKDRLADGRRIVERTGSMLLSGESEAEGFIEFARAIHVGAAQHEQRYGDNLHRGIATVVRQGALLERCVAKAPA